VVVRGLRAEADGDLIVAALALQRSAAEVGCAFLNTGVD
jgi:hypothetical protein